MTSKLKWVNSQLSQFDVVTSTYLNKYGISRSHVQNYIKGQWLTRIANGVYTQNSSQPSWSAIVSALQFQLELSIHLSGLSSLAQQGVSQYLTVGSETIRLSSSQSTRLPKWVFEQNWRFEHKVSNVLSATQTEDIIELTIDNQVVRASVLELAILEILEQIGDESSFQSASEIFQGLTTLRPRKLQSLLERSSSIKVKRLFLFFAHYYQHPWLKRIDETVLELGSGNRQIVKGGYLNKRYQITIPPSHLMEEQ